MNVWVIYDAHTGKQVGPACFSIDQARDRIDDLLAGKKRIWMGWIPFKKKPLA